MAGSIKNGSSIFSLQAKEVPAASTKPSSVRDRICSLEYILIGIQYQLFVPVPVNATVCGLVLSLSSMVTVPFCVPSSVGVNVTLMIQLAPDANVAGQLLV